MRYAHEVEKIFNHFGISQYEKLHEECLEYVNAETPYEWDDEAADVFIVALQLFLHNPSIRKRVRYKIKRTLKRIKEGYYER